jgi:hypothetical protein
MTDADRELVERVARGMGWKVERSPDGKASWVETGGSASAFWLYMPGGEFVPQWNPLTDANADLQVLERAREMWDGEAFAAFANELEGVGWELADDATVEKMYTVPFLHNTLATSTYFYRCGHYARAFDAVLTSTMGATDDK